MRKRTLHLYRLRRPAHYVVIASVAIWGTAEVINLAGGTTYFSPHAYSIVALAATLCCLYLYANAPAREVAEWIRDSRQYHAEQAGRHTVANLDRQRRAPSGSLLFASVAAGMSVVAIVLASRLDSQFAMLRRQPPDTHVTVVVPTPTDAPDATSTTTRATRNPRSHTTRVVVSRGPDGHQGGSYDPPAAPSSPGRSGQPPSPSPTPPPPASGSPDPSGGPTTVPTPGPIRQLFAALLP